MDDIWHSAPAPALRIRTRQGAVVGVEPNAAARRWGRSEGLADADWQALAERAAGPAVPAPARLQVGARELGVVAVPLADGLLLWLQPGPTDANDDARHRLDATQRAAEFLDRALLLAGVSVWRVDLEAQRIHFNAIGFRTAGMREDPAGIPLAAMRDTIHPDDLDAVVRAADEAVASDRVVDVVARYRNVDGSWRTLLTRRVADRDAQGRAVALAGISLDLSAQLRERERADGYAERARLVAEAIGVGFWSLDVENARMEWDEQMFCIHRRDPARGAPAPLAWIDEHVHPDDRAWVAERVRRADAQWEPMTEMTFRVPDGPEGERWVQSWARRVKRGERPWVFGINLDVSERQREQLHLQRERERVQFAIDTAAIGLWERDAQGVLTRWNDAMYRQRGLDPADPRPVEEIARETTPPEDAARLEALRRQHLGHGEPYRAEFRVRHADGRWRWLVTQGHAFHDGAGRLLGSVGVNLDVTERKEAEALQREKERVEQASRDKSAFMTRISHELRTPLNAVLGFTRLIEDDLQEPPSARQRERLRQVGTAAARLLGMVDDLLEIAHVEAESAPPLRRPLALDGVLDEAVAAVQPLANERGIDLDALDAAPDLQVLADRARLLRALTLLLQHALRRSARGSRVSLDAYAAEAAGPPRAIVRVLDDGPGLTAAQHLWLFESFAPDEAAAAEDEELGLRLSLARGLLTSMEGQVEAVGAAGGGTELRIELPLAGATDAPLEVLCVEDNPVNLQLVCELVALRPAVRLRTAVDGQSGIAAARAEPPDLLLLDLQLPDLHGIEVMRRLRAEAALADTSFVAVSADAMPEHVQSALEAGFDAYWTKPLDFGRFLSELDRFAALHRRRR